MMKIGVTGGIGSGKSTVCRLFAQKGVAVYDSDAAAKRLMQQDDALRVRLTERFGAGTFRDGQLDRGYLAGVVFSDPRRSPTSMRWLHPVVMGGFDAWAARQEGPYVFSKARFSSKPVSKRASTRPSRSSRRANCASSAPAAATTAAPMR